MLSGFIRPEIILPSENFDEDALRLIFRHELIHFKRGDLFIKLLMVIASSLHWFNPIVCWMCAVMQADGEAACDEAVLRGADTDNRRFYCELIIGMIGSKSPVKTMLSTCFYGGKTGIKKRLASIMDSTENAKPPMTPALLGAAALTFFSGSVFVTADTRPEATIPVRIQMQEPSIPSAERVPDVEDALTPEMAEELALTHVGGGTVIEYETDYENGRKVYEIKIMYESTEYEMDVDAVTGAVTNEKAEAIQQPDRHPPKKEDDD